MDVAIMLGGVRVHEPAANVFALSAKLSQQAGSAPTLSLSVAPDHPAASALTSDAAGEVTLTEDGTTTFRGRVTSVDVAIDGTRSVRCEDSLAYLNDTTQRPFKNYETNSVAGKVGAPLRGDDLFAWLVGRHNDLVGEDRRLYVDTNEGSSFGPVPLANNQYPTTRNAIDQMLKASGGYVWTSYRDGRRYVNWTVRGRGRCAQPIEFGTNIVDFTRSLSAGGRTTAIVPTGEALKTGDRAQVLTLSGSAPSLPSRYLQRGEEIAAQLPPGNTAAAGILESRMIILTEQGRYAEALQTISRLEELMQLQQVIPPHKLLGNKSRCLAALGRYDEAYRLEHEAAVMADSLHSAESQRRLDELATDYRVMEKELEVARLSARQARSQRSIGASRRPRIA